MDYLVDGLLDLSGYDNGDRSGFPSMQSPKNPGIVLKYSLIPQEKGVLLCIWEPAPLSENRIKPFLYMIRHRFPTEREAKEVLKLYLSIYH